MTRTKYNNQVMVRTKFKEEKVEIRGRRGRTGSYKDQMILEVEDLVGKLGARNKDLALYFGVVESTIDYWMKTKPEFAKAVKRGRITAALKVSRALYSRAVGYSHPDTHIIPNRIKVYDKEGNLVETRTEALIVPITKHYPPETFAAHKYLSIIFREVWADVSRMSIDHKHSGDINIHKIEELSMDDLSKEMKDLLFDLNVKQLKDANPN